MNLQVMDRRSDRCGGVGGSACICRPISDVTCITVDRSTRRAQEPVCNVSNISVVRSGAPRERRRRRTIYTVLVANSTRRSVTIDDVAREAGVSRAAVSKVIRNAYGVSPGMRERVEAAIAELGYRPSVAARAMRGSSYRLGLEIPHIGARFMAQIVEGAKAALAGTPYQLVRRAGRRARVRRHRGPGRRPRRRHRRDLAHGRPGLAGGPGPPSPGRDAGPARPARCTTTRWWATTWPGRAR